MPKKQTNTEPTRFAIYARFSSDVQNEITLESQESTCRKEIAARGGIVTNVYADAARFGWSLDREQFNQLRADAAKGMFDAVIMWKFDRLARDLTQATMIKALLRHEYGLKLYCVEGYSEDDDNSPYTALMEQMLAVFSAFYSKNLSTEIKRSKLHNFERGQYHGSTPPLGYCLATNKPSKHPRSFRATNECPAGLYVHPRSAALVRRAFKMYATGEYSFRDIAAHLNRYLNQLGMPEGKPISAEMMREILQNKLYAGYVSYAEHIYKGGFGQSSVSRRGRVNWTKGIHQAIITEELYDKVQSIRIAKGRGMPSSKVGEYLLEKKCYCSYCLTSPAAIDHRRQKAYGRMRGMLTNQKGRTYTYYRCASEIRGYGECPQCLVRTEKLDSELLDVLFSLHLYLPENIHEVAAQIVSGQLEQAAAMERMEALRQQVERIDFSWEKGYISPEEYVLKREQLLHDIEASRPLDYDKLLDGATLIRDFRTHWNKCQTLKEQRGLIDRLVDRVVIKDEHIEVLVLRGDISLLIGVLQNRRGRDSNPR